MKFPPRLWIDSTQIEMDNVWFLYHLRKVHGETEYLSRQEHEHLESKVAQRFTDQLNIETELRERLAKTKFDLEQEVIDFGRSNEKLYKERDELRKALKLQEENNHWIAEQRDELRQQLSKAEEALKSIADSCPGPEQEFEIENKLIAKAYFKEPK
jgi:hypothetical protein